MTSERFHSDAAVRGLRPGSPVSGRVAVPCSKSLAQRALVCASLAGGTTRITALDVEGSRSDDVCRAIALVAQAGAGVERLAPAAISVSGRPPGPHRGWNPAQPLEAGESGTLARLATAAGAFCALAGRPIELHARGTLLSRASPPLFAALRGAGVRIGRSEHARTDRARAAPADGWPAHIVPIGPPSTVHLVAPVSSQEVSALLIALSAYPDATQLVVSGTIPSRPYLSMTLAVLSDFGARVTVSERGDDEVFDVRGPLAAPATPIAIEPDASAAAVALAAACLSGGSVSVSGLRADSRQGDARIVEHLRAFGCDARLDERGATARGAPNRGAAIELSGAPDLAPVLAVIAARAALDGAGSSALTGLGTLQGKESPRIEVLARMLERTGVGVETREDALMIHTLPGSAPPVGAVRIDPRGDHRMAFAGALLGLVREGITVDEAGCVAKSWPRFWSAMHAAGANVHGAIP